MFQLLNVNALLAHDYQLPGAASGWRIARLDMVGGHESDSAAWSVTLTKGPARRLLSWSEFLGQATPVGGKDTPVGEVLARVLAALEKRLHDRPRRRDFAAALRRGVPPSQAVDGLLLGDPELEVWSQTGLALDSRVSPIAAELLTDLESHLLADRAVLLRSGPAPAPAPALALTIPAPAADAPPAPRRNELSERLDQGCAACRALLTLSGSDPNPDRAAAVAQAIVTGSVEACLDEMLRSQFPDTAFALAVRTTAPPADPAEAGMQAYTAEMPVDVPLWSLAQKTKLTLHLRLAAGAPARSMRAPLQELLGGFARLLNGWSAQRERPLISGGEGWLCLLDYMNWDTTLFDRWLAAAPLHERIARFDYLGQPPQARDRLAGWQALLAGIVAERGQLRPADWSRIAPRLSLWNETDQVELRSTLRKRTLDRLRAERSATAELREWIDAWRAGGAPGRAGDLFEDLRLRALRTRDPDDAALATTFWRDADRPADWVPDLAGAWQAQPNCAAELVTELAAALPAPDDRRLASAAVLDCCAATGGASAAALAPLAQAEPAPAAWRFDAVWSETLAASFASWTAALDRTQQHEQWKKLLAHRATLAAAGLLRDT